MTLTDLKTIFQPQLDHHVDDVYYLLIDGEYKLVEKTPVIELSTLIPMLECFIPDGYIGNMPRFRK